MTLPVYDRPRAEAMHDRDAPWWMRAQIAADHDFARRLWPVPVKRSKRK
jgi:hypothetical protein